MKITGNLKIVYTVDGRVKETNIVDVPIKDAQQIIANYMEESNIQVIWELDK